jgi:hypothetical protein
MISMNYLVYLNAQAGELEKILSGLKTMLVKEFDPAQPTAQPVKPGDSLYFLRDRDDCAMRVKATVIDVLLFTKNTHEDLSQLLKEVQPRLQLTEAQFNHWSAKGQVLLVEFESAQKISVIRVAAPGVTDQSDWIAFEAFSLVAI